MFSILIRAMANWANPERVGFGKRVENLALPRPAPNTDWWVDQSSTKKKQKGVLCLDGLVDWRVDPQKKFKNKKQ